MNGIETYALWSQPVHLNRLISPLSKSSFDSVSIETFNELNKVILTFELHLGHSISVVYGPGIFTHYIRIMGEVKEERGAQET